MNNSAIVMIKSTYFCILCDLRPVDTPNLFLLSASIVNLRPVDLIFKVFLCFGNSVASTRFLLQDEFNIQTTQCDNCIIVCAISAVSQFFLYNSQCPLFIMCSKIIQGFMFCLQQLACIFSIIALIVGSEEIQEASQLLSCLANMVYCT